MDRGPLACAALVGVAAGAAGVLTVQHFRQRPVSVKSRIFFGIDIGGTTLTIGLVDDTGSILGLVASEPLGDDHDPALIAGRLAVLARVVLKSASCDMRDVAGVGVCAPGLLDFDRGYVKAAANLRGWTEVPLCQLMADALGISRSLVVLENDGNTALLAELWIGAAKGKKDVVLLTLGTGIGAGIVCGGQLVRGSQGQAGELGHAILVPGGRPSAATGVEGIWEAYASATAVKARAADGPVPQGSHQGVGGVPASSSLHGLSTEALTCKAVFKQAAAGDAYAQSIVRDTAKYIAIGCINCCRSFDPEVILFTGGMADAGEQLLSQVKEQFAKHHWSIAPVTLKFDIALSPAHAGLIGAAYAACRACRSPYSHAPETLQVAQHIGHTGTTGGSAS